MPLTAKGSKIMRHMRGTYGSEKVKRVFYASKNKGNISGVDRQDAEWPSEWKAVTEGEYNQYKIGDPCEKDGRKGKVIDKMLHKAPGRSKFGTGRPTPMVKIQFETRGDADSELPPPPPKSTAEKLGLVENRLDKIARRFDAMCARRDAASRADIPDPTLGAAAGIIGGGALIGFGARALRESYKGFKAERARKRQAQPTTPKVRQPDPAPTGKYRHPSGKVLGPLPKKGYGLLGPKEGGRVPKGDAFGRQAGRYPGEAGFSQFTGAAKPKWYEHSEQPKQGAGSQWSAPSLQQKGPTVPARARHPVLRGDAPPLPMNAMAPRAAAPKPGLMKRAGQKLGLAKPALKPSFQGLHPQSGAGLRKAFKTAMPKPPTLPKPSAKLRVT